MGIYFKNGYPLLRMDMCLIWISTLKMDIHFKNGEGKQAPISSVLIIRGQMNLREIYAIFTIKKHIINMLFKKYMTCEAFERFLCIYYLNKDN